MATLSELFGKLDESLVSAKAELAEFESGKKASALRLRKQAQVSKRVWQEIRGAVQSQYKAMPTKKREPKAPAPPEAPVA
jgi:hypothetical protein